MPFEYRLMVRGHNECEKTSLRREAKWVAMILTGLIREEITPEQLLGEVESSEAAKLKDAAARVERMLKKRRKLFGKGA